MDEPIEDVSFSTCPPEFPRERHDLQCGECGGLMQLRKSKFGPFYGCASWPICEGTHGANQDGSPKGTPANKATRMARIRAHSIFDLIWKQAGKKRHEAYAWMRKAMGLSRSQAHIAMFTESQCELLIKLVYRDFPQFSTRYTRLIYDEFEDES